MTAPPRVAVVGCGGLGVPAAWTLVLGGVRHLRLIDADAIELSNLHRQVLYTTAAVGQAKAAALASALRDRQDGLDIEVCSARLDAASAAQLLAGCSAVFEGSDDASAKFAVNDWAVARPRTRHAVIAAAIGRRGQWMHIGPTTACYRCLFEAPPPADQLATCQVAGVLGPTVGVSGAMAARSLLLALEGGEDAAHGALVRWQPRGLLRTFVQTAARCMCSIEA